jgi:hypothetical protein
VKNPQSVRTYGQLPQNPEMERSLLGAILLDSDALRITEEILQVSDFFVPAHQRIFQAMTRLAANKHPVELLTICDALNSDLEVAAAGGAAYLAKLADGIHRKAPISHWARIIRNNSVLRSVASAGEHFVQLALEPGATAENVVAHLQALGKTYGNRQSCLSSSLSAVFAEELLAREIKPRRLLLDPLLPEQGLVMLYAYRGIGKTCVALGIAAAVANGGVFLRWRAPRPRRVLYIDGELPASTLQQRVRMILAGLEECQPQSGAFQLVTPDLQKRPMPDLATIEGQNLLEPLAAEVDLIILDNLSALCRSGSENDGEDWAPVQEWTLRLRRQGKSVLLVHHAGKNKAQRGTSKREDLLDTVITLRHPSDYSASEGLRCEVHFEKTRSMLGEDAKPFEIRLETGPDGRAVWLCRDLDNIKAQKAAELFAAKMSVREVAEELGISKSAAGRYRTQWKANRSKGVSQCPTSTDVGQRDSIVQ